MADLSHHTIWISGAARRVGREIALACAHQGARIVLHYNTSHAEAEDTAQAIHKLGGQSYLVQADLSRVDEIRSAVQEVVAHWPTITAVIHNAAVFFPTPLDALTEMEWDLILDSNLKGPCFLTQELLPTLRQSKQAKLIFIGDKNITPPAQRFIPYAVSKAGLQSLAAGFEKMLHPHIRVKYLAPGPILPSEDTRIHTPTATGDLATLIQDITNFLET